jgi:hypothetical protein
VLGTACMGPGMEPAYMNVMFVMTPHVKGLLLTLGC